MSNKFDISFSFQDPKLNGSAGLYRNTVKVNIIGFDTDKQAVEAFLDEYMDSPATLRMYTKECDRLLMWAVLWLRKPLSSMDRDDFNAYIEFMRSPSADWCGPKANRELESWRPFTGPLSDSAIKTAIACINSLMSWLVNAGYLSGNPLGLIRNKRNKSKENSAYKKVERFLDEDMWAALLSVVETMPTKTMAESFHKERMRFILTFFTLLGGRVSEVSHTQMGSFKNNVGGWFWDVTGKGSKEANVAMPKDMVDALMRWRKVLGLPAIPRSSETTPAIPFVTKACKPIFNKPGISPRRLNQLLKEFFGMAAAKLEAGGQEDKAEKIKMASAHWLRHTSITQKVNAGIDRRLVQIEARHADARTTSMYTHDEERIRSEESQKHKINWKDKDNAPT